VFFRTNQLGRTIVHGSGEGQYWWPLAKPAAAGAPAKAGRLSGMLEQVSIGAAAFVDSARVTRRLLPGDRNDVDAGVGLRLGLPGGNGIVRVDVARGLINPGYKLSFAFEP